MVSELSTSRVMVFPVKVFTKICILQERKKKFEQNLGLRGRTTETTPQRTIQELQKRESSKAANQARENQEQERGKGRREKEWSSKGRGARALCRAWCRLFSFFLSCPIARLPEVPCTAGYLRTYLPTYLPT
jgi:hypothetical protein